MTSNFLEDLNNSPSGGTSYSFNSNAYFGYRYVQNEEGFITFLTDLKRSLKINRHYDKAKKQYRTCNKTYGKDRPCEDCESSDKDLKRTSPTRFFLVWNHNIASDPVGRREDGTEFFKNPLQIYGAKRGDGGENFLAIEDNNGEDPSYYYDDPKNPGKVNPDLLKENDLFFNEHGQDKVWKIKRTGGKDPSSGRETKTVYPPIAMAEHKEVRKALNLDKDALIKVPLEIRNAVNKLTLMDLAGHYFTQVNDINWELLADHGVFPPGEGSRIGDEPKEESNSREAAGAKL